MGSLRRLGSLCCVALVMIAACGADDGPTPAPTSGDIATVPSTAGRPAADHAATVRIVFGGDVMLGRRVAAVVAHDASSVFEGVRHTLTVADLAMANLESPLSDVAPGGQLDLVADPVGAQLLAQAGFDAVNVANNHAGDAGPTSVRDTLTWLERAGIEPIGVAGADGRPQLAVAEIGGLRIVTLGFDLTGQSPGGELAHWDDTAVAGAVAEARSSADVVTVSLHGGVEHLPRPDPALSRAAAGLAGWGVDVVWAHGAHVTYDVAELDPDGDGRPTLVAHGLGNLLFDQRLPGTEEGLLLEVLVGPDGVRAYRTGLVRHHDLRVSPPAWQAPHSPAVFTAGTWWALVGDVHLEPARTTDPERLPHIGDIEAVGRGDVDGDGDDEIVAAFLRPFRPTLVNQRFAEVRWVDEQGRSAHLGIYDAATGEPEWVAGSVPRPIGDLAVCDGAIAVAYRATVGVNEAGGAWWWRDFGLAVSPDVAGAGAVGCADVDGDGHSEPVQLRDPGA